MTKRLNPNRTFGTRIKLFLQDEPHQHSRVNCQEYNSSDSLKVCWFLLKIRSLKLLNLAYILRHAKHLHDAPADIDLWKDQFAKFFLL